MICFNCRTDIKNDLSHIIKVDEIKLDRHRKTHVLIKKRYQIETY